MGRRLRAKNHSYRNQKDERNYRILDVEFQRKHTFYLVTAVMGAVLVFLVPSLYFVYSNYKLLSVLVDKTDPLLYDELHRESIWLVGFFMASLASLTGVCTYLGFRVTNRLLGPVHAVEAEMLKVAAGDGSQARMRFRIEDDFKGFTTTYKALVESLRNQSRTDLQNLQRIQFDPEDRISKQAWTSLVEQKSKFLGIEAAYLENGTKTDIKSGLDVKSDEGNGRRRAS